jgi:cytoskeletal protein CcmA (bactofilin family)
MSEYYGEASVGGYLSETPFQRSSSIRSEGHLDLKGPLEVLGSVKSGRGINFEGDVIIRDKIDAYGNIDINGNLSCE